MAVLCPRCDADAPDRASGDPCPKCGTKLIGIASGEPDDDLLGTTIDKRFEIVARLGRGGMGTVYRARQTSMDREVAVKMIDRDYERDVTAVKRFFREAQLASKLAHPNTVSVIEFGQDATGRMYIAMELVRGETLAALARREGALSVARVVHLGVQLCDALEAAHALGVVHRDLKLDNVMVLEGGRDLVKVLDFGLARNLKDGANATASGMIAGTPRYLAPEVALSGADPAPAQDLYALGVILGELACGHELWDAPTIEELFARKAFAPVVLDDVPDALASLVQRLVNPEPGMRPKPAAVREALLALASEGILASSAAAGRLGLIDPTRRPAAPDLERDRTVSDAHVIATGDTMSAFPDIRPSAIVPLDEAPRAASRIQRVARPLAELPPGGPPEIPMDTKEIARLSGGEAPPLEVDREWTAERAAKHAAATAVKVLPPHHSSRPLVYLVIAVIVLGGGGVALFSQHHHKAPVVQDELGRETVTIHVTTTTPVKLMIDDKYYGKTPITLDLQRGGKPIILSAEIDGHTVSKQVMLDHNQSIELDNAAD